MRYIFLIILSLLLTATITKAQYCCTGFKLDQAAQHADIITTGSILSIKPITYLRHTVFKYTIKKNTVYKGDTTSSIVDMYYYAKHPHSPYIKDSTYLFLADSRINNELQQLDVPEQFLYIHPCTGRATTAILNKLGVELPILKRF